MGLEKKSVSVFGTLTKIWWLFWGVSYGVLSSRVEKYVEQTLVVVPGVDILDFLPNN